MIFNLIRPCTSLINNKSRQISYFLRGFSNFYRLSNPAPSQFAFHTLCSHKTSQSTYNHSKLSTKSAAGRSSNENGNPRPFPFKKLLWVVAFSSGLSISLILFMYYNGKPFDVSIRVFEEFLARGEVREIYIIPSRATAVVVLQSAQYIDGNLVHVISVSFEGKTMDVEQYIRSFESKLGVPSTDQIPIIKKEEKSFFDLLTSLIITSGFLATLAFFLIKRRLSNMKKFSNMHPEEMIRTAFRTKPSEFKKPVKPEKNSEQSSGKPAHEDQPSTGDNFPGNFGNGLPFMQSMTGISDIKPTTTNITFNDVAGMHAGKEEVMEFVFYLRNPEKYMALGAKLPKGALLLGPPGTGKTLLVKALANEAGVPFYSMAGSEFIEVIGGLGASRIRKLFQKARQTSPSIIFIDEIDSVGRRRSGSGQQKSSGGGGSEMEQTLNQLLVEMDGMDTAEGTIVFAATNRGDLLDKALLRAGRFDRHIFIDLPNMSERKELFEMYLKKYQLSSLINIPSLRNRMATWTSGMNGADIAGLCNEAALIAARQTDISAGVEEKDFDAALERILAGAAKRSSPLTLLERRVAAVQEAGRALVASLLPNTGLIPFRVSIIPRVQSGEPGESVGYTQFIPEEKYLMSIDDIADRMAVLLAGRAAEQFIFKAISDASQRYLEKATSLAYKEVREWGMSKSIGHLSFSKESTSPYGVLPYSKRTAAMIDMEVAALITSAFQRAVKLIQTHEDELMKLIKLLLEHEVITSQQLHDIISIKNN